MSMVRCLKSSGLARQCLLNVTTILLIAGGNLHNIISACKIASQASHSHIRLKIVILGPTSISLVTENLLDYIYFFVLLTRPSEALRAQSCENLPRLRCHCSSIIAKAIGDSDAIYDNGVTIRPQDLI